MKIALITGGSKGLGKALVERFAKDGWETRELSRTGSTIGHVDIDLSKPSNATSVVDELFLELSSLAWKEIALINNAGTLSPIKKVHAILPQELQSNLSINILSAITIMQLFIKYFRDLNSRKTIVNISSGAASKGYPGWSLYCAAKAGCKNFVNAVALEEQHEKYPFRVMNFDPHVMDTQMQKEIRNSDIVHFPQKNRFIEYKDTGRLLNPNEVASILVSLLSGPNDLKEIQYSVRDINLG
ncbi:MAG: SDR family NAD(P)-dependent oxidoreductase [Planctomycetes bacterium]|nr:SDR family NAD(P)-dependent oxidoreductase [Planctomycetota bacterium]